MQAPRTTYHHGDLKQTLVSEGLRLVEAEGARHLSLKALAARCGVSTPALYHHFKNKDELDEALAVQALAQFEGALAPSLRRDDGFSLEAFSHAYVTFATERPELYDLVFGKTTWRSPRGEVHRRARRSFRTFVERLEEEKARGRVPASEDALRVAQVTWATLHGLCRMHEDGLAFSREAVIDVARYAARLVSRATSQENTSR